MKKTIWLYIVIIIVAVLGLLPIIDGYYFKNIYLEKVAYYREQMRSDDMELQVESYHVGWMQSIATLTITKSMGSARSGFHLQPMVMRITSIIHHGPVIFANKQMRIGSAYVQTAVDLPDILKIFIPQNTNGFLQIESTVSLNGNRWHSHYLVPAVISPARGGWEGLNGDIVVNSVDGVPVKINNQAVFGRLAIPAFSPLFPEIKLEPISTDTVITRKYENIWVGSGNLKTPGIYAKWQDNSVFNLNNLSIQSSYDASNNLYSYTTDFAINSMQLPPPAAIAQISNLTATFAVKNLDINGLHNFKEYSKAVRSSGDEAQKRDLILKLLSPSTSLDVHGKMNTDQGPVSSNINVALLSLPKTSEAIENNLNASFQLRMAQNVFNKLLVNYLVQQYNRQHYTTSPYETTPAVALSPETMTSLSQEAQTIIKQLIAWNYIQQDNTDYVIAYTRKGIENTLNGKPMTDEQLKAAEMNTAQLINKSNTTTTTTTTATSTVPVTSVVTPAVPAANSNAKYACYWMENASGKNQWIPAPNVSQADCYRLDSCSGGMKQSNGGCYKWASSADAKGEPWNGVH